MLEFEDDVFKNFPKEKILKRFRTVVTELCAFSSQFKLGSYIHVDFNSVYLFLEYYFGDVIKIKIFHNIEQINTRKIYAYMAYWFLRRHPLQIIKPCPKSYINERFVLQWLISRILTECNCDVSAGNNAIITDFATTLFYNLKHRHYTAQSLEMMTEAFYAGLMCIKAQNQSEVIS